MLTNGKKFDDGKIRLDLVDIDAIKGLAEVLTHGAQKYGDRNWEKGLEWNRVYGALLRHLTSWWNGEDIDPESGLRHIDHAMCNMMFLSAYTKRSLGTDTRPGKQKKREFWWDKRVKL